LQPASLLYFLLFRSFLCYYCIAATCFRSNCTCLSVSRQHVALLFRLLYSFLGWVILWVGCFCAGFLAVGFLCVILCCCHSTRANVSVRVDRHCYSSDCHALDLASALDPSRSSLDYLFARPSLLLRILARFLVVLRTVAVFCSARALTSHRVEDNKTKRVAK